MHVISDLGGPGGTPPHQPDTVLAASIDVEWSKNYRITNGNKAFCYSIVWLRLPAHPKRAVRVSTALTYQATSVYLDSDAERADLAAMAATDIAAAAQAADLIAGHQLCSDLAVLSANAGPKVPAALIAARQAWHERRTDSQRRIIDTRFDAGHLLHNPSRRLVDVCTELDLDVTQPELARKSMTALHRDWLTRADTEARERVTVLNLRHSLSTALVALRTAGRVAWTGPLNVNAVIARHLPAGRVGWVASPTFRALVRPGRPA